MLSLHLHMHSLTRCDWEITECLWCKNVLGIVTEYFVSVVFRAPIDAWQLEWFSGRWTMKSETRHHMSKTSQSNVRSDLDMSLFFIWTEQEIVYLLISPTTTPMKRNQSQLKMTCASLLPFREALYRRFHLCVMAIINWMFSFINKQFFVSIHQHRLLWPVVSRSIGEHGRNSSWSKLFVSFLFRAPPARRLRWLRFRLSPSFIPVFCTNCSTSISVTFGLVGGDHFLCRRRLLRWLRKCTDVMEHV